MNSLDFFRAIGDLEPSLALDYNIMIPYWMQITLSYQWYMQSRPGRYKDEEERDERWYNRFDEKVAKVH